MVALDRTGSTRREPGAGYSVSMPQTPDLAGHALDGRYELHEVLGEGAFGRVYQGIDRRLGRTVAVKVIKPWWAEDSVWVERFQREARLLASVNDPGVVQIFDIGHAEEGPYYVAELVTGESLADRLRRGPLPVEQARTIAERLCRALGSAHRQGVLHCDVKPANVLLGVGGEVKVGDFGVARLAESTSQAHSATVAGTPRYMSPEQARGRRTTAAADVYSAGVVLYEMLAGRPPFLDGSAVELGLRHLQDQPPPLPASTPRPLQELVERALAKDPSRRYPDGTAMADALQAASSSPAIMQAPPAPATAPADEQPGVQRRSPRAGARAGVVDDWETINLKPARDGASTRVLPGASGPTPAGGGSGSRVPAGRRVIALIVAGLLAVGALTAALVLTGQPARTTVPDLQGLSRAGVEARARRLHVSPALSRRHSESPAGVAIAQSPAPGTRVAQGATVRVVLSAGPPPVPVPMVLGSSAASAESLIANAGLRYSATAVAAPGTVAGVVVRQSPGAPGILPRGSTVALAVAEFPRWRTLTTFSGVNSGKSVPFRILGSRWRVSYSMAYQGMCLLLVVCEGPSAEAVAPQTDSGEGSFELSEGEYQTHVFDSGPGLYRLVVSGGRDSASWTMTVQDYY